MHILLLARSLAKRTTACKMSPPIEPRELESRMRAFGGGSVRSTYSLIDRALSRRSDLASLATLSAIRLERISAPSIVKLARSLQFDGEEMSLLFTDKVEDAAAFLFSACLNGGSSPGVGDAVAWATQLADAHAAALYHLRSQFWNQSDAQLHTGRTMDSVIRSASDSSCENTFRQHSLRLSARLKCLAARHLHAPPSRVRWGYVAGRLPAGHWPPSYETTDTFLSIVESIVDERGMTHSLDVAKSSFARKSVSGVVDFSSTMDVSWALPETDLREIRSVVSCVEDFVLSVSALRAFAAKNVWVDAYDTEHQTTEIEIYRAGGWFAADSTRSVALSLILSTVTDLDKRRSECEWLADEFPTRFTVATNAVLSSVVDRVAELLRSCNFFAHMSRKSRRPRVETVDPLLSVRPPPPRFALTAQPGTDSSSLSANGLPDMNTLPSTYGDRDADEVCLFGDEDSDDMSDSVLFVEGGVIPPLEVRDRHEDGASVGGATCFKFDEDCGRWRVVLDQEKGSVYITSVRRYLGYRGFARSTFVVDAYGPNGEAMRDVVALVSYDRTRLDSRIASEMDALEGLPSAVGRSNRPWYRPYIARGLRLTERVRQLACDHLHPFPEVLHDPPSEDLRITAHCRDERDGAYEYLTQAGPSFRVPCEGWGPEVDAHIRSETRAFWRHRLCAACPHDMRMRMTKSTTHVLFDDGNGAVVAKRFNFERQTILNVWDGRIAMADERDDCIVYVIDNDLPDSRYRLAVVTGLAVGDPGLPASTARMIHSFWARRGQTCPHLCCDTMDGVDDSQLLVPPISMSASEASRWLWTQSGAVWHEGV